MRFAEACTAWSSRKDADLGDLLVERGWISAQDRLHINYLLERKLQKHRGDARASLAEVTNDRVRESLAELTDPDIQQSITGTLSQAGSAVVRTMEHIPEGRQHYTLSRLHATGGMGQIWVARDDALGRDVALKELRPDQSGNEVIRARFLQEARITGQLEHPSVVPIYEVGLHADERSPYYTMRFVRGRTLAEAAEQYHRRRAQGTAGPLELRELLTAFVAVCNVVAYAHSRGVLHRDLKPHNVILGDYGEVILLDWGLARFIDAPDTSDDRIPIPIEATGDLVATMQGQALGTPGYMAPEQAEGRLNQLGARTDVYGLGAILYEILTANPPFSGSDTATILRRVSSDEVEPPRLVVPTTPPALEAICLKALAKKPMARYDTAKELAREIQRWLADEPVTAWPESLLTRSGRWVRRHRTGVATALAALIVAVGGLLAVAAVQADSGRQLAEKNRQLEASNERLEAARDRAERRVDLALGAVESFRSAVNDNLDVQNRPENDALRKTLLRAPLAFYQKLRDDFRDTDQPEAKAQAKLANAYFQLASLDLDLGSQSEAMQAYNEAVNLLEPLAQNSSDAGIRDELAKVLRNRGDLESQSQVSTAAALQSYNRARDLLETRVKEDPGNLTVRLSLAATLSSAGLMEARIGKADEGLGILKKSVEVLEEARRREPENKKVRLRLSELQQESATILRSNKSRIREAFTATEAALQIAEPLAREAPADVECQQNLARIYATLASLYAATGSREKSLEYNQKQLAVCEALARAHPSVSRHRFSLIQAMSSLGFDLASLGRPADAIATFQKARDGATALVRDQPTNASYKEVLSETLNGMAFAQFDLSKPADALSSVEAQSVVLEQIVKLDALNVNRQRQLAGCYYNCGAINVSLKRDDVGLKWYERSLQLREKLAKDHPDDPRFPFDVASTLGNMANIRHERNLLEEAAKDYGRAIEILQKLSAKYPEKSEYRTFLARTRGNLGDTLGDLNRPNDSLAVLLPAVAVFEKAAQEHPDVAQNQADLMQILKQLSKAQLKSKQPDKALESLQRSLEMRERKFKAVPDSTDARQEVASALVSRGTVYREMGKSELAVADYRRAIQLCEGVPDQQPDALFLLASAHASRARLAGMAGSGISTDAARAETEKALTLLEKAVTSGFATIYELERSEEIETLRTRPEYRKLINLVKEKAGAKSPADQR
jgi:serine/threonine-protein kinase